MRRDWSNVMRHVILGKVIYYPTALDSFWTSYLDYSPYFPENACSCEVQPTLSYNRCPTLVRIIFRTMQLGPLRYI